jgi:type IV secretion system protein VirB9
MKRFLIIALLLTSWVGQAEAISISRPIGNESRIKVINYLPNSVIKFLGHYNYHSIIEFSLDEEIKTITMGDSTAWQLNPAGNRIFLKPIGLDATTNMTVITNRRTYFFEMHANYAEDINDPNLAFITKFIYPEAAPSLPGISTATSGGLDLTRPSQYNFKYKISGKGTNIEPLLIFDDGRFTYFKFKNINADLPSIFIVDQNLNESLINYRISEGYLVVERVTGKFTLRQGKDVICVFNEKKDKMISVPNFIKNTDENQMIKPVL